MKTTRNIRWIAGLAIALATAFAALRAGAQQPGDAAPAPKADDMSTTITLSLNNVPIEQLVQFLSETTGKPVIKQKDIQFNLTITSPSPVTKRQAIDLIYEALRLENIYVIEMDGTLQIVPLGAIKGMQITNLPEDQNVQELPDSLLMAQKIYRIKNIRPENLQPHLDKLIPTSAMTYDPKSNTLIVTDQVQNLKRYDLIIKALDTVDAADRVIETFTLTHSDAIEISVLLGNVLLNAQTTFGGARGVQSAFGSFYQGRTGASGREKGESAPIIIGDVTIVPDPRLNRIIISCPQKQVEQITKLIKDFDQEEEIDLQTRLIPIKHVEATAVAGVITQIFRDSGGRAAKDVIRAIPYEDGSTLLVYSSLANFELIKELVAQLDVEGAEKKETRAFTLQHLTAQDMADQLTQLWDASPGGRGRGSSGYSYNYYYASPASGTSGQPSFVPSPRTNSLMVLARPKDFPFIEELIKDLDVPMDPGAFQPRIYKIRHTDAAEMVKVLETLFAGDSKKKSTSFNYDYWRPQSGQPKDDLAELFGQIRFVVDSVTNTLVALASNPKNYDILDKLIEQLDRVDPEATEVLVYDLKHADAIEVSNQLNNLFSDGAVQQPQQPASTQQKTDTSTTKSSTSQTAEVAAAVTQAIFYPWQSSQRTTGQNGAQEARPINSMIGNVRVVPDKRSNKLMVAAAPIYFNALRGVIEGLDQPEPQVHIKTRIVEIQRGTERRIGLHWTPDPNTIDSSELDTAILGLGQLGFLDSYGGRNGSPFTVKSDKGSGGLLRSISTTTHPGNMLLGADVNLAVLLQLLLKNSDAKIVSEPAITVNNNELGQIFVGSKFPFRTNSQTTDNGTVTFGIEYRDVGVSLDITPHINLQGEVVVTCDLENSQVRDETIDGQIVEDSSMFHTEIAVESKQTMVIAGILVENDSEAKRQVPILGRIPIVNLLFKKSDRTNSLRELVVFITPEVLDNRKQDDAILRDALIRLDEVDAHAKRTGDRQGPATIEPPPADSEGAPAAAPQEQPSAIGPSEPPVAEEKP